jgi:hypothetical protein
VKRLNAKDIHKEIFPVYSGKCLSHKGVHNWVHKFSLGRFKVADDARPAAKVAETTVKKDFYAAGFDALVKRWDKCIYIGGGYVQKCFFQVRIAHVSSFISISDLFTDSPSYFFKEGPQGT